MSRESHVNQHSQVGNPKDLKDPVPKKFLLKPIVFPVFSFATRAHFSEDENQIQVNSYHDKPVELGSHVRGQRREQIVVKLVLICP